MFKVKIILYFLAYFLCLKKVNGEGVLLGTLSDGDRLIHKSVHEKIPFVFRSSDVAFPQYYEEKDNVITAIKVIDNNLQDGASVEVDYGGVGFTYANVHLRSALWSGFNFTVEIYGSKLK